MNDDVCKIAQIALTRAGALNRNWVVPAEVARAIFVLLNELELITGTSQEEMNTEPENTATFKIRERVSWESQSQGSFTIKVGTIEAILSPGERPSQKVFPDLYKGAGPGHGRKGYSYVVLVGNKHYWPLTKNLEIVFSHEH